LRYDVARTREEAGMQGDTESPEPRLVDEPEYLTVTSGLPAVRAVGRDAPWRWLRRGLADLRAAPAASLFYGGVLTALGIVLTHSPSRGAVELALLTGVLIVGPFLLMGLYDISRRLERGEPAPLRPTLVAWKANSSAIGFYAVILALLLAVWIRVSVVVVALFFDASITSIESLWESLRRSPDALVFVGVYLAAGFGFALFVFATSVVSLPMLFDRTEMDALSAMITSFNALRRSFGTMLVWAALIVGLTALGFALLYVGLIVILPLIGHATWHAYRDMVE
jgi:uncharacterized membrane protein